VAVSFAPGAAVCRATFLLVARLELQKTDPRLTTWHALISSTAVLAVAASVTMNWHSPQTAYGWFLVLILRGVLQESKDQRLTQQKAY
jgi:hypothetical protein